MNERSIVHLNNYYLKYDLRFSCDFHCDFHCSMTNFVQIVILTMAVLCLEGNGNPLFQGISFQRGFEINFKPLPRNPITFIKEKWSPFGVFGRKHSIQKRNSGRSVVPVSQAPPAVPLASEVPEARPAAPVFEHVEEIEHLQTPPFIPPSQQIPISVVPLPISSPMPPPVSPIQPQLISPVPPIASLPPPFMPTNVIITPAPQPSFNYMPPPLITPQVVSISPNQPIPKEEPLEPPFVRMEGSLPPISSNMVIPPPASGRFTDVTRAELVREYMNSIQPIPPPPPPLVVEEKPTPPLETNSIKPEPPRNDIPINDNSLIRGSKIALYFGSIFLQLMSQFMSNARATFDQMTNPPPVFNN
ncbi:hypothetical protein PYW07_009133 [Mythimna separata]|uniref:Uncharacterized protein n=1 Tax=Mythimna separata TaxID=271217 RepID=A0AAD7YB19_MYTSE|nr:hypothetical protein PYW07_009133 [Mythimna separata]